MENVDVGGGMPPSTSSFSPILPPVDTFRCLCQMGLSISVNNARVVNTVSTILSEVMYQKVALLFRGL